MEMFSALLAICEENSPVTCEFPAQRPVTRSFDVLFDLHGWVNNDVAGDLRRHRAHYDVTAVTPFISGCMIFVKICNNSCSIPKIQPMLTHCGRVVHICVSKKAIIGSDNSLLSVRRRTIIWIYDGLLSIGTLGTNINEI